MDNNGNTRYDNEATKPVSWYNCILVQSIIQLRQDTATTASVARLGLANWIYSSLIH